MDYAARIEKFLLGVLELLDFTLWVESCSSSVYIYLQTRIMCCANGWMQHYF